MAAQSSPGVEEQGITQPVIQECSSKMIKKQLLIVACLFVLLLSGCASTSKKPFPPFPYFFSADASRKTLFDGYKTTYKDFKSFDVAFDRFIIVDEYARLRKIDMSQQTIRETEACFALKAKNNENILMTEVMDSCFEDINQVNWDKIDAKLFSTIKQETGESDAEVYQAMGLTHLKQEKWDRAEKYFNKAVELNPKLQWSWYNLALLNTDTEEGYNYNKKATEANPKFSIPYYWMAYYRCRNREDAKAIPLFKKYLEVADPRDPVEESRIKVAKKVLVELLAGKEGQNLSMMRRSKEE